MKKVLFSLLFASISMMAFSQIDIPIEEIINHFNKAQDYSGNHQNELAFKEYKYCADHGFAVAQYNLYFMYMRGIGCSPNGSEALRYLRMAANQQLPDAMVDLGNAYYEGYGGVRDLREAVLWYRKAADKGDAEGQYCMGLSYSNGEGVEQNYSEALRWYRKAANQGHGLAAANLATMLLRGMGCQQDIVEAFKWLQQGADKGSVSSQYTLGLWYLDGSEKLKTVFGTSRVPYIPQDKKKALEYLTKAAEQGNTNAQMLVLDLMNE